MNQHRYLRAYMAGITVPTIFLLFAVTVFCIARYVYNFPAPIERVMVFPMAVVPNLWGLWNMLFVALPAGKRLAIGFHGALLPLILGPLGMLLTRTLDFQLPTFSSNIFPVVAVGVLTAYYLVWKYVVGSLNQVLAIASSGR
jgi:hypothetical protein